MHRRLLRYFASLHHPEHATMCSLDRSTFFLTSLVYYEIGAFMMFNQDCI